MKSVIFDMDGVLFDTERLAVKAWDEIGVKAGLGKVGYMVYKTLGRTTEESVKIFEKEFGNKFNNNVFQALYKEYLDEYYKNNPVPVKDGVIPCLTFLKENGYKTALASSSSQKSVMHHLESAKITKYFDKIICGDTVKKSKPEPDIYLKACSEIGEKSENCYAVEDSRSGIWSAHRAKCKVVFIPDIYTPDAETQNIIDLQFDTMNELTEYLMNNE